jgi:ABC-type lipoprotein release transport system permease subunit
MLSIKLAFRNLFGAGLRTWLNVAVLSFAFFVIVFYNGMLDGWNRQARNDSHDWETGSGQLWHKAYDRYDPFTLQEAHQPISDELIQSVQEGSLTPLLFTQASIYPNGRMMNITLKGIDPEQRVLKLPSTLLHGDPSYIPAIIGQKMSASTGLQKGDIVTLQWRDRNGTFDAREIMIVSVFNTNVPSIDVGQLWIPLEVLREMTGMKNEATILVASAAYVPASTKDWKFVTENALLKELDDIINQKKGSSMIIYGLLMAIALLAIFDTQVLSIFRRQREIGTLIALGMTRSQVVKIFTVEGSAHSFLAILVSALYAVPLLGFLQSNGIPMPKSASEAGIAISDKIIPYYGLGMVLTTITLVILSSTIVSYFPSRKISHMSPTDALKGKIQ